MAKKKKLQFHFYECTITGEKYKLTKEAKNPDELMSVKAYYELHSDEDDRPEHIKVQLEE